MSKAILEERLRSAKPDYIELNKERILSNMTSTTVESTSRTNWWTLKKALSFMVLPLAALSAVGFADKNHFWINNGSVTAYTGPITHQMKLDGVKSMGGLMTKNGPFIQAKHPIALPQSQILSTQNTGGAAMNALNQVSLHTNEVILMGVPFIRMNLINHNNYAHPNMDYTSLSEMFIPAKHAIQLPADEIAHSYKEQTTSTKEILLPGKQHRPQIRWDVITPDNNANYK